MEGSKKKVDLSSWTTNAAGQRQQEFFETDLEYEKYLLDPKNEKNWDDINKDLALGNLEDWEHQAILNQEKTLRGLLGMKDSIGNQTIGELFVPEGLLKLYRRMPAFTLAVSLSKDGFKQKLMRSFEKKQSLTAREESPFDYKRGWSPFRRKKKEGEQ